MKSSVIVVGLVLPLGLALAQNAGPAGSQSGESQNKSASTKADERKGNPAELKTQTYTGVLVDANCGAGGSAVTSSNAPSSNSDKSSARGNQAAADRSASGTSSNSKGGEASRTEGANCAASAKTSSFGLRMKDGHVIRFDAVGNERATEAFSAKKKWADASAAGKDIQATVNGAETGDTVTVLSIR